MGTRGAVGFRLNKQDKVMYNHFDSYPDGLGLDVAKFCDQTRGIDLRPFVEGIELVQESDTPTPEQIEHCKEYYNQLVHIGSREDWYCLLREAQGNLDAYVNGLKYMLDSQDFLSDSLFCEWAYIINLDEGVLEVYEGFNKDQEAPGRYADVEPDGGYCGVALLRTIPLDQPVEDQMQVLIKEREGDK